MSSLDGRGPSTLLALIQILSTLPSLKTSLHQGGRPLCHAYFPDAAGRLGRDLQLLFVAACGEGGGNRRPPNADLDRADRPQRSAAQLVLWHNCPPREEAMAAEP